MDAVIYSVAGGGGSGHNVLVLSGFHKSYKIVCMVKKKYKNSLFKLL